MPGHRLGVARLVLEVEPAFDEQEMVTEATTGISYWEGSITIKGRRDQQPVATHEEPREMQAEQRERNPGRYRDYRLPEPDGQRNEQHFYDVVQQRQHA